MTNYRAYGLLRNASFLLVIGVLLSSCEWDKDRYLMAVKGAMTNVQAIEFAFEEPFGKRLRIENDEEIDAVRKWLAGAAPPASLGSYADPVVEVFVKKKNGTVHKFRMSQLVPGLGYATLYWDGTLLVADEFPLLKADDKR